jgi:cytochrome c peroxidase
VRFYAERDTQPQKWFPRAADGTVLKYDDLPGKFQGNVDVEPPFDRHAGDQALTWKVDLKVCDQAQHEDDV